MNDLIACRPLETPTMREAERMRRTAARYSDLVRERDYLVGLMFVAARTGDTDLKARTEKRLAEVEIECDQCYSALRGGGPEMLSEAA